MNVRIALSGAGRAEARLLEAIEWLSILSLGSFRLIGARTTRLLRSERQRLEDADDLGYEAPRDLDPDRHASDIEQVDPQ